MYPRQLGNLQFIHVPGPHTWAICDLHNVVLYHPEASNNGIKILDCTKKYFAFTHINRLMPLKYLFFSNKTPSREYPNAVKFRTGVLIQCLWRLIYVTWTFVTIILHTKWSWKSQLRWQCETTSYRAPLTSSPVLSDQAKNDCSAFFIAAVMSSAQAKHVVHRLPQLLSDAHMLFL